ncbi:hypothetical protein [Kibdelosporangium aridum]|uniref:hypothetical protein n=1 Tax=Kibdelosporangium aridum TaxID=2030 RepID=UPI000AA8DEB9
MLLADRTRGIRSGLITHHPPLAADEGSCGAVSRFAGGNLERNLAIVAKLNELAAAKGITPGQLAFAWMQHQGEDVVPIPVAEQPVRTGLRSFTQGWIGSGAENHFGPRRTRR